MPSFKKKKKDIEDHAQKIDENIELPGVGFDANIMLDLSTSKPLRVGARFYLGSNRGAEVYLGYKFSNIKVSIGTGFAKSSVAMKIKCKDGDAENKKMSTFEYTYNARVDYYISLDAANPENNLIIFVGYQFCNYAITPFSAIDNGTGHAGFLGVAKAL